MNTFSLSLLSTMAQTLHAQNLGAPFPRKNQENLFLGEFIRRIEACWKGWKSGTALPSLSLSLSVPKGTLVTHPSSAFSKELPSSLSCHYTKDKTTSLADTLLAWFMDSPTYSGPVLPMIFTFTWGVPLRMLEVAEVTITAPVSCGVWALGSPS